MFFIGNLGMSGVMQADVLVHVSTSTHRVYVVRLWVVVLHIADLGMCDKLPFGRGYGHVGDGLGQWGRRISDPVTILGKVGRLKHCFALA